MVAPPAGADPHLWQMFNAVDTDRSGALSVTELQNALVNGAISKMMVYRALTEIGLIRELDQ